MIVRFYVRIIVNINELICVYRVLMYIYEMFMYYDDIGDRKV